jgi:hypothetical protein
VCGTDGTISWRTQAHYALPHHTSKAMCSLASPITTATTETGPDDCDRDDHDDHGNHDPIITEGITTIAAAIATAAGKPSEANHPEPAENGDSLRALPSLLCLL